MLTDYPYIKIQRRTIQKLVLVFLPLCLLLSCTQEENTLSDMPARKDQCRATLGIKIRAFDRYGSTGTRSVGGNDDENRINNIWVFQYNAETGASLHVPVYLDDFNSNDIEVDLTLNENGAQSLVCIVANVGEFVEAGDISGTKRERWALDENNDIKADFNTYEKLLQQTIPETVSQPFISSNMGATGGKAIPMFGVSKAMPIVSKCYVSIPLIRMFARMEVEVEPSYPHQLGMEIKNITLHNIPLYCRVGTMAPAEDDVRAAAYPDIVTWSKFEAGKADNVTIYFPENLQGIVSGMDSKQDAITGFPEKALKVDVTMSYDNGTKEHIYTVYPGLDMINDFNIKRNHIYNVSIIIKKLPE